MKLGKVIRAGRFRKDAKLNPDGEYDLLVLEVDVNIDVSPPAIKSVEWRLESSKKKRPFLTLNNLESTEALVTFFNQNSFAVKLPVSEPAAPNSTTP